MGSRCSKWYTINLFGWSSEIIFTGGMYLKKSILIITNAKQIYNIDFTLIKTLQV